jgi:hypothetical protein
MDGSPDKLIPLSRDLIPLGHDLYLSGYQPILLSHELGPVSRELIALSHQLCPVSRELISLGDQTPIHEMRDLFTHPGVPCGSQETHTGFFDRHR